MVFSERSAILQYRIEDSEKAVVPAAIESTDCYPDVARDIYFTCGVTWCILWIDHSVCRREGNSTLLVSPYDHQLSVVLPEAPNKDVAQVASESKRCSFTLSRKVLFFRGRIGHFVETGCIGP